ncbi:MAG: VOC family protein [Phenylobacterium sp.]|uniref:VOC family protein n=1 Tax=Phenylobacterium sp. TaxID=1871053 RepID=UPI001A636C57|nr:VOC family protein [Phenylobacterium sp.]MBL8552902.1 VOC family protein [Phenylobacterium sp.]
MTIGSLGYLGLRVKDPAAFGDYVTGVLGLMPGEAAGRYRLDDLAWRIAVEPGDADDLAYVGFEVAGPAELEAVRARLAESGVTVGNSDPDLAARRQVLGLVACEDPDGLPVEIFYGPTLRTEAPFASPAGVADFVTGAQGLGHIVLSTRDMAAARRFYQDLLGFQLSDIIHMGPPNRGFDMEFFHCNPRHHTLALMPIPLPKRLHHFMVQVPTLDAVGFALERATAAGVTITASLGRHTNDQMVSFYSRTPAGFEVEFGQGAIEVDDATWRVGRHDKPSSWGHKRPAH